MPSNRRGAEDIQPDHGGRRHLRFLTGAKAIFRSTRLIVDAGRTTAAGRSSCEKPSASSSVSADQRTPDPRSIAWSETRGARPRRRPSTSSAGRRRPCSATRSYSSSRRASVSAQEFTLYLTSRAKPTIDVRVRHCVAATFVRYLTWRIEIDLIPRKLCLTRGVGVHPDTMPGHCARRASPSSARCASSIFPPHRQIVPREEGPAAATRRDRPDRHAECRATAGRRIAARIGVARTDRPRQVRNDSEHHTYGRPSMEAGDYAEDLAATMRPRSVSVSMPKDSSGNGTLMGGEIDACLLYDGGDACRAVVDGGHAHPDPAAPR